MKIALLGGSFNPVHKGHLALAESAISLAGYDKVVFVPAYQSPFKQRCSQDIVTVPEIEAVVQKDETVPVIRKGTFSSFSDDERIEMLRLAIKPYPWAELELCEIERGGVSYTIDTVRFLTEKYKTEGLLPENSLNISGQTGDLSADAASGRVFLDGRLGLIIGADLAEGFYRWKEADALAREADIILARRPGGTETDFPYPHKAIMNDMYDISSTEVRSRIAAHEDISPLIPDEICRYIEQRCICGPER